MKKLITILVMVMTTVSVLLADTVVTYHQPGLFECLGTTGTNLIVGTGQAVVGITAGVGATAVGVAAGVGATAVGLTKAVIQTAPELITGSDRTYVIQQPTTTVVNNGYAQPVYAQPVQTAPIVTTPIPTGMSVVSPTPIYYNPTTTYINSSFVNTSYYQY